MPDFSSMTPAELQDSLLLRVRESNLLSEALTKMGVPVHMDVVDRPSGHPEIQVVAGQVRLPPAE